ncbi:YmL10 [Saxophila tyrrhenica]|uniref:YmL10 n=1 Tax=Saxophila tyrrhenica TaxID=1690608 RepID=A0AAV9P523_9PEZI|nr:YmL10 [Saxophila tyrrhenica]
MPPRLTLLSLPSRPSTAYTPLAPFLYPPSTRAASILTSLSDNRGAYNKKIRRGRGPSSGKGKTSGRGHKGQGQHGKVPAGFNGGQTPESVVHGERGFDNSAFKADFSPVNLNKIQYWVDQGRLDPKTPITLKELAKSRCIHGVKKDGVKLLARGKEEITTPVHLIVSRASASAVAAVEKAGGTVTTRYYSPFSIPKIRQGLMHPYHSLQSRITFPETVEADAPPTPEQFVFEKGGYKYRLPDPTSRKSLEYYRDEAKRGYLSYVVGKKEGPSLFFRVPEEGKQKVRRRKTGKSSSGQGAENRLW